MKKTKHQIINRGVATRICMEKFCHFATCLVQDHFASNSMVIKSQLILKCMYVVLMVTVDTGMIFPHTDFTLCRTPNKLLMAEKMLLTSLKPKELGTFFTVYVTFRLIGG